MLQKQSHNCELAGRIWYVAAILDCFLQWEAIPMR